MQLRKFAVGIVLATVFTGSMAPGTATGDQNTQEDRALSKIRELANRVHDRWGLTIDPSDYEIVQTGGAEVVQPKGARLIVSDRESATGGASNFSLETSPPSFPTEGTVGTTASARWDQPKCYARTDNAQGWMDTCYQWGDMNYSNATRANFGLRMYATCAPKASSPLTELDYCFVDSVRKPGSATLYWNDWSPKSSRTLSECSDVNLSISYAGVGAGYTLHTCDKLYPTKGSAPADFRSTWEGDAWGPRNDSRETALLVGLGTAWGNTVQLTLSWEFGWSSCNLAPSLDQCG